MSLFDRILGKNSEFDKNTYVVVSLSSTEQTVFTIKQALTLMVSKKCYYSLEDMVLYNVPIRDVIRKRGMSYVAQRLLSFVPTDEQLTAEMERIERRMKDMQLADFDIQLLPVSVPLFFFGKSVTLRDLKMCCEIARRVGRWTSTYERKNTSLHVADVFEPYPCFDAEDYGCESRDYDNYFVSDKPFTEADCLEIEKLPHAMDYRFVVDKLPAKYLPVVYRDGNSRLLYVATAKDNPQMTAAILAKHPDKKVKG